MILLAAVVLAAALAPAAVAGTTYYVNNSSGALTTELGELYAIGSGGVARVAGAPVSVLTGDGLTTLGGAVPLDGDPAQAGLTVGGNIRIPSDVVRIGLYFGDTAQEAVTLKNVVGSGYEFGYFDAKRAFHTVGYTQDTSITVVIDRNVSLSAGTVGCFHILLPETYPDFPAAAAAASAWADGFVGYYGGVYRVLLGSFTTRDAAAADAASRGVSGEAYSASSRCVVVTRTGSTRILFEFDCGSQYGLAVRPVSAAGGAVTSLGNYRYNGDFQFTRLDGEKMTVVNSVRMEDYIKGVVSVEMHESWPLEALKAQAVAARTYAARNLGGYGQYGFDVTGTASSQAYGGTAAVGPNITAAVDSTAGLYLTYGGQLCDALYFSSSGGGTEDSENVFPNALPYLRGVLDPYEKAADDINGHRSWTRSWTRDSIRSKITALGYSFGTLAEILPTYSDTGNVIKLAFVDTEGRAVTFSAGGCYAFCRYGARLNLPSIHFTVQVSPTNPDVYVFSGSGWGHNVGMSQFGAYAMAKYYGKTYDQILAFYYTGAGLSRGVTDA